MRCLLLSFVHLHAISCMLPLQLNPKNGISEKIDQQQQKNYILNLKDGCAMTAGGNLFQWNDEWTPRQNIPSVSVRVNDQIGNLFFFSFSSCSLVLCYFDAFYIYLSILFCSFFYYLADGISLNNKYCSYFIRCVCFSFTMLKIKKNFISLHLGLPIPNIIFGRLLHTV